MSLSMMMAHRGTLLYYEISLIPVSYVLHRPAKFIMVNMVHGRILQIPLCIALTLYSYLHYGGTAANGHRTWIRWTLAILVTIVQLDSNWSGVLGPHKVMSKDIEEAMHGTPLMAMSYSMLYNVSSPVPGLLTLNIKLII